ncbi:hypothetical protein BHC52_05655 [Snodgrassella alvi]|nr:hypothetical protein BHC52_05655 [Snodgrassella alvi]
MVCCNRFMVFIVIGMAVSKYYYSSSEAELIKCLEKIFYISQAELNRSQQKFFNVFSNYYEEKVYTGNCKK